MALNAHIRKLKTGAALWGACAVLALFLPTPAAAQSHVVAGAPIILPEAPQAAPLISLPGSSVLQNVVFRTALSAGSVEGQALYDIEALRRSYEARGGALIWQGATRPPEWRAALLTLFEESWTHGLNPAHYHVEKIRRLMTPSSAAERMTLDLLLSDAVMRYGRDMTGMRVTPESVRQQAKFWQKPLEGQVVLDRIATASDPLQALDDLAPRSGVYDRLRAELRALVNAPDSYDHVLPLDFAMPYFKPGNRHPAVEGLRVRLDVAYDPAFGPVDYYDDDLAAAVMNFQRANGLEPDAVIGSQTLALLNRTRRVRMEQIVANLERMRWLEQERPARYMLVNIPSQTLWGVEDGRVSLEMPVVVGLKSRPTQSFKANITGVRFNPTWTVPLRLKMEDILPHLLEDPDYLDQKGMEVMQGYGENAVTLDPHDIDWAHMGWADMNRLRMIQTPGDHNALGRVRVLMQNEFDIYMHDTNHPEYFARNQRTYSSGCIRLSQPYDVARFILARNENWGEEDMRAVLDLGEMQDVIAAQSMPVYIVYQTVWLDASGRIVFGPDVYQQDKRLIEALNEIHGYAFPGTVLAEGEKAGTPNQLALMH